MNRLVKKSGTQYISFSFRAEAKNVTITTNVTDEIIFTDVPFTLTLQLIDADTMEPVDPSQLSVMFNDISLIQSVVM